MILFNDGSEALHTTLPAKPGIIRNADAAVSTKRHIILLAYLMVASRGQVTSPDQKNTTQKPFLILG